MNRSLLAACVVLAVLSLAAWTPAAEPAWRAKGPSTVFTPDSAADATDAAATAEFLQGQDHLLELAAPLAPGDLHLRSTSSGTIRPAWLVYAS